MPSSVRVLAMVFMAGATGVHALAPAAPALRLPGALPGAATALARGTRPHIRRLQTAGTAVSSSAIRLGRSSRARTWLGAVGGEAEAEATRDADELKTGVQLRTPDIDKLCLWVTDEITLWLDQDWIEREVHGKMGEQSASTVRRMVDSGDVGISSILFAVAEDLGATNFPRLFESDVNEYDVANKVSDLLLQSMNVDVCCTSAPITGLPDYGAAAASVPAKVASGFLAPETSVEKYLFLQKALDGRISVQDLNSAVLLTLGEDVLTGMGVTDGSSLNFFAGDFKAIEDLDEALQNKLEETNKRDSDLDPVLEALHGEELLKVERDAGEPEFLRRETCVKWLHVAGGY